MRLTSWDLKEMGIVEHVIPEKKLLTKETLNEVTDTLHQGIRAFLQSYCVMSDQELLQHRYERFRRM